MEGDAGEQLAGGGRADGVDDGAPAGIDHVHAEVVGQRIHTPAVGRQPDRKNAPGGHDDGVDRLILGHIHDRDRPSILVADVRRLPVRAHPHLRWKGSYGNEL